MSPVIQNYKLMKFVDGSFQRPIQFTSRRNQENGIQNPLYSDWMDV